MSRARSIFVAAAGLSLAACSGLEASLGDDAGTDATIDGRASDPGVPATEGWITDASAIVPENATCPPGLPESGADCPTSGLWCEYDGGAHERCSASAYCGIAQWSVAPPDPTCTLTNGVACPAAYGESPDASCPSSASCDYDAGRCACVECAIDGGFDRFQWFCRAWGDVGAYLDDGGAAPGLQGACPADRPPLGSPCDAGFECGYGACYGVSLGPYEWCRSGRWAVGPQTDLCNPPACR